MREVPRDEVQSGQPAESFRVRQAGALSSFSLPDKPYYDGVWQRCNGEGQPRSESLCRDLQMEHQRLQRLARIGGCDLLVSPNIRYSHRGKDAMIARIGVLIDFLESTANSIPDFRIVVVDEPLPVNLLVLGDWFVAESTTPVGGMGYVQTLGTWHAPTVLRRKDEFDHDFSRALVQSKIQGDFVNIGAAGK